MIAHGFVERADRKRRHLGFDFERWVDQSGVPFLSSVFSLFSVVPLFVYTRRCFGSLALEGVSVWEGRVCPFVIVG